MVEHLSRQVEAIGAAHPLSQVAGRHRGDSFAVEAEGWVHESRYWILMARPSTSPRELRERAVRLVTKSKGEYPSEFESIRSIAATLGNLSVRAVAGR
jgi:hypothetical protein